MSQIETKEAGISWFQKIGNRIVLTAIIAAILPLVLLGGTVALKVRLDLLNQTIASQKNQAATLVHGIGALFQSYKRQIDAIAGLPAIQSMKPEVQAPVAMDFLNQQRSFFSCTIYDPQGQITLETIRNQTAPSRLDNKPAKDHSAEFKMAFATVVKNRQASIYASAAEHPHQRLLQLMVPINDFVSPEKIVGVIGCSISISSPDIHEIVAGFPVQAGDILVLLDRNGVIISSRGNLPENVSAVKVDNAGKRGPESIEITLGGIRFLGTVAPVAGSEGLLLVARPRHLVLEFLNQLLLDLALMLLLAFVIAITMGFLMARPLAGGISRLVEAIRDVSSGVVSNRLEITGEDELSEAGKAFNEMLNTLEKHRMMDDIWSREWQAAQDDEDIPAEPRP